MQKIAIAFFAIFLFEGIRREVENIAGGAVQSAAVDGKVAACGVIGNQVIGRGRGRIFTEWVAQACPIRILVDSFYRSALSL